MAEVEDRRNSWLVAELAYLPIPFHISRSQNEGALVNTKRLDQRIIIIDIVLLITILNQDEISFSMLKPGAYGTPFPSGSIFQHHFHAGAVLISEHQFARPIRGVALDEHNFFVNARDFLGNNSVHCRRKSGTLI